MERKRTRTVGLALVGLAAAGAVSIAASPPKTSVDAALDRLERLRQVREVAIAPDGGRVAWLERSPGDERLSSVWVADVAAPRPRRVTAARDGQEHRERGAAFSPDGKSLAFLSDAGQPGQLQIWIASASGSTPRPLTRVSGQLDHPRWSPDSRSIAFLFVEGSPQEPGALVAYKPDSGLVAEKLEEQRIAVADVGTGRVRNVSPANLYVYDYDWSPDGKRFVAEAAEGSGTNNYWVAELYLIDRDSGKARSVWKPPLQIASPRFSADGRTIALIHGIMSDEGSNGGDIWAVPADGGDPKNLTPGIPSSPRSLFWRQSGEILFTENVDGEMGIGALDPASGRVETLWKAPEAIAGFAVARDGVASAVIRDSFARPPEVWAGTIGSWKPITRVNAGIEPLWGKAESLHWDSGGRRVQGWLLAPKDVEPGKRYPMAVSVHGGPSSAHTPAWPSRWNAMLPSQGYFLFLPNPRGSFGFGEAFAQANVKDFGHGDLADILSGVNEVLRRAPVDGGRVGILGWSYGGYMTMWAVTQTSRFRAAVAGAGIADWRSYYGQNRIDRWMVPFFGASVYDDPAVYAKSSPIEFIKNAKTPTLVLHGDRDSEVPVPQGYEFWHALKTLGVPTQLVIYPDEGHSIRRPGHRRDIIRRSVAWFDEYLK
jgi:dipeptidyl aminopeptidase/acylaminoacyl peptidase